jgi:hypothetical protein
MAGIYLNENRLHLFLFAVPLVVVLAACVSGTQTVTPLPGDAKISTAAVQTFSAQITLSSGQTAVAQLTQIALNNLAVTPLPQATLPATLTPPPPATSTPVPPSQTPTPLICDWAQLVTSLTVDDGALFQPGSPFTKVWRLKNIGSCTWTPGYALVFTSGDKLDGRDSVPLAGNVAPGQTVDVSVDLISANAPGVYTGYWQLRNASGVIFGTGGQANSPFWVKIKVGQRLQVVYEFVSILCAASWNTSAAGQLDCPSPGYDTINGFVYVEPNPVLENGATAAQPAIITYPSQGSGSMISGEYPAFKVKDGDRFKTTIGCLYESISCNVVFMLNYSIDGGPVQNLGTWVETYTKRYQVLDIDLSQLAGKSVEFILTVINNGSLTENWAFWLLPAIYR